MEPTPEAYVTRLVSLFALLRPALRDDGTVWLNLGDSYSKGETDGSAYHSIPALHHGESVVSGGIGGVTPDGSSLAAKNLVGIPWRVAFALQADGWYLRSDIIWHKPNPMPESITDRPTKSHEYLFLLSKSPRYYYDAEAIKEPSVYPEGSRTDVERGGFGGKWTDPGKEAFRSIGDTRNKRTVWTIPTRPFSQAHFAVFPPNLVKPCILAGVPERCCPICGAPWERQVEHTPMEFRPSARQADKHDAGLVTALHGTLLKPATTKTVGFTPTCSCMPRNMYDAVTLPESVPGTVLDPFMGSGTTAEVARSLGRKAVGFELNADYIDIAAKHRLAQGVLL